MKNGTPLTGILAAVRSLDALGVKGTHTALSRRYGVTRSALYNWQNDKIPLKRLPRMVEITGLPIRILRPDYRKAFKAEMGITPEMFFKQERKAKR